MTYQLYKDFILWSLSQAEIIRDQHEMLLMMYDCCEGNTQDNLLAHWCLHAIYWTKWNSTDQKVEQDKPQFMLVKFQYLASVTVYQR